MKKLSCKTLNIKIEYILELASWKKILVINNFQLFAIFCDSFINKHVNIIYKYEIINFNFN